MLAVTGTASPAPGPAASHRVGLNAHVWAAGARARTSGRLEGPSELGIPFVPTVADHTLRREVGDGRLSPETEPRIDVRCPFTNADRAPGVLSLEAATSDD